MLLLDGAIQLSESDGIYTSTLMSGLCYDDADVLILGGGDGALLAKLVTDHCPRMVTMVELDGEVMTSVRDHMHSVTGGVLDHHTGDNYNIITGDAVQHLEDCVKDGKQYDFIFGDLTDIPIDTDPEGIININLTQQSSKCLFQLQSCGTSSLKFFNSVCQVSN